jgi:hypothetical protein
LIPEELFVLAASHRQTKKYSLCVLRAFAVKRGGDGVF